MGEALALSALKNPFLDAENGIPSPG